LILSIKNHLIRAVFTFWNKPMKIDNVNLFQLDMPLAHPFETSFGIEHRRQCILIAASAEGLTGWGECVALDRPSYSAETIGTAWHILEDFLIPEVLTNSWQDMNDFLKPLSWIKGNPMAKAGLQGAAWDLLAQSQNLSLAAMLAQPYSEGSRDRVPVGVSIGIQTNIQATLERIEKFLKEGFSRIKLKIKPGWDVELLQAVREQFADIGLMVDANSAYTMADLDVLRSMDQFNLIMLEQPLEHDDIFQHSQLQEMISTPICLDESITSPALAAWAIKIGACQMINIKPGRVGGLWEARLIHDICRVEGIPVWCGGMLETGIGRAANLAISSLPNFLLPTDNGPTARYWEEDIIDEEFILDQSDSTISVPNKLGLGVTPSPARIEKYLVRTESFLK
jgi:O-succinylbenzoate synthase